MCVNEVQVLIHKIPEKEDMSLLPVVTNHSVALVTLAFLMLISCTTHRLNLQLTSVRGTQLTRALYDIVRYA